MKKILIMGLPGSGKTTLAKKLVPLLSAVHWNADQVRSNINTDLGFSIADRLTQSRRMGWLCDQVNISGHYAVADFVCPTTETRQVFDADFAIFMNTIESSRYADTNAIFQTPSEFECDYIISEFDSDYHSTEIARIIQGN